MKTKEGVPLRNACENAFIFSVNFDSEVWRPRIEEHTISISEPIELDSVIAEFKKNQFSLRTTGSYIANRWHMLLQKPQVKDENTGFKKNILFLMTLKPHFPNTEPSDFLIHVEATCPALRVSTTCPTCP